MYSKEGFTHIPPASKAYWKWPPHSSDFRLSCAHILKDEEDVLWGQSKASDINTPFIHMHEVGRPDTIALCPHSLISGDDTGVTIEYNVMTLERLAKIGKLRKLRKIIYF